MRQTIAVLSLGAVLVMVGPAAAFTTSSIDGSWSNIVAPAAASPTYQTDTTVGYGNGNERQVRWGQVLTGPSGQSGLGFTGIAPPGSTFPVDTAFQIGQLRHFNYPILRDTAATAVDLTVAISFSDPAGQSGSFTFTLGVNETPNDYGDSRDDDFIYFPTSYAPETLTVGATVYNMELLGFGPSADVLSTQFRSGEGTTNSTLLWGRVTEAVVPVPGAVLLAGLGSGLVAAWRRRVR